MPDENEFEPLTESEILVEGLCMEATPSLVIPKSGPIVRDDHTVEISVIRPCVSRGKRIRGLPPIYEPSMLSRNAKVFEGWPMFFGHVTPKMMEFFAKHGRNPADMAARLVETWYDPTHTTADDEKFGYQAGRIAGRAILQEAAERIVKRDPEALQTSIAAWPTGVAAGTASWDKTLKGAAIEGFRPKPRGSVDFVLAAGAGGRIHVPQTREEMEQYEEWAMTVLEGAYAESGVTPGESGYASRAMPDRAPDFSKMNADEIREWLKENADESVLERIEIRAPKAATTPSAAATSTPSPEGGASTLTTETLTEALRKQREEMEASFERKLAERETQLKESSEQGVDRKLRTRELAMEAKSIIDRAEGLTATARGILRAKFSVDSEGSAAPALSEVGPLTEAESWDDDAKSDDDVLKHRVAEAIQEQRNIIREARGEPIVTEQGGAPADREKSTETAAEQPAWRGRAVDLGIVESEDEALAMVTDAKPKPEKKDD